MNNRYYIYKSKRREVDKIQFRDDKIFVSYLPMTKKNINYYCELKQASSYTDFVFEITSFEKAYCPEFLKTKLRYLERYADKEMQEQYQKEFETKFYDYLSILNEKEIINTMFNFGKFVHKNTNVKLEDEYYKNMKIENFYDKTLSLVIKKLSEVNINKLNNEICKINAKIGCTSKFTNNKICWNIFIYSCLISYLFIECIEGRYNTFINYSEVLRYICYKEFGITSEHCIFVEEVYETPKNKSSVTPIDNLEYFMYIYLYENYINRNSACWYGDHMMDLVEEYMVEKINNTKNIKTKEKYENYTYKEWENRYIRNLKDY